MFNSLRPRAPPSTASSSSPTTQQGVQHPLLGGLSRRESMTDREKDRDRDAADRTKASGSGDPPGPPVPQVVVPYKPRQRHSHSGSVATVGQITGTGTGMGPVPGTVAANARDLAAASPTISLSASYTHASGAAVGGRGGVTSRLQLQQLKAAAQRAGVAEAQGVVGMGLLEVGFERSRGGGGGRGWKGVVEVMMGGKATLLLPTTPASSVPLTPQTFRDHLVFTTPGSSVVVTLSGLVGSVNGDTLRFTSCLPEGHVLLTALKDPATRGPALHALEPLVAELEPSTNATTKFSRSTPTASPSSGTTTAWPTCTISHRTTLPFPAPPSPSQNTLPEGTRTPETVTRSRSGSGASLASIGAGISSVVSGIGSGEGKLGVEGKAGRLNPFAGLFGAREREKKSVEKEGEGRVDDGAAELPEIGSVDRADGEDGEETSEMSGNVILDAENASTGETVPGLSSGPTEATSTPDGFQVPAWTIDRTIKYSEITRSLGKAISRRIKDRLDGVPDKVVERVVKFVSASHPCYTAEGTGLLSASTSTFNALGSTDEPLHFRNADETSATYQRFMGSVYDELYAHHLAAALTPQSPVVPPSGLAGLRRRGSLRKGQAIPVAQEVESEVDPREKERTEKARLHAAEELAEEQAVAGTDRVESVLCELFYISLFSPSTSDDSKHDIALSSRIAALNMLDLSLEHLGVVVKETAAEPGKEAELADRNLRVESGLQKMIERVGNLLQGLNDSVNCTPKAKSDILIQAHKIVINGLENMPKIRLRPEGEDPESPEPSISPPAVDLALSGQTELPTTESTITVTDDTARPVNEQEDNSDALATPVPDRPAVIPSALALPDLVLPDAAQQMSLHEAMSNQITPKTETADPNSQEDLPKEGSTIGSAVSGADLLLPLIIYAIVKSNPARLVSHLLYIQRYRTSGCATGEANYVTVNITAAVEFLECVDLADLGLSSAEKVMSVEDLSPIGLTFYKDTDADTASIASASSKLKGRVQQVGELAGTAAGSARAVVDSSWSALRGLVTPNLGLRPVTSRDSDASSDTNPPERPKLATRRSSGFSFANVTASVANIANAAQAHRERPRSHTWSAGREMTEVVNRPASIREVDEDSDHGLPGGASDDCDSDTEHGGRHGASSTSINDIAALLRRKPSDVRSIRSVTSMMSGTGAEENRSERLSISDRFANLSVLAKSSTHTPSESVPAPKPQGSLSASSTPRNPLGRRTTWSTSLELEPSLTPRSHESPMVSPLLSSPQLQAENIDAGPPLERFLTCEISDLRLSEVGELLRDYRRLARLMSMPPGSS